MDTVERGSEIKRTCAERIFGSARHMARQIRTPAQHLPGRRPVRPFALGAHAGRAAPGEAVTADADPVLKGLAIAEHEIEAALARIDHNGSGPMIARIADCGARYRRTAEAEQARHPGAPGYRLIEIDGPPLRIRIG